MAPQRPDDECHHERDGESDDRDRRESLPPLRRAPHPVSVPPDPGSGGGSRPVEPVGDGGPGAGDCSGTDGRPAGRGGVPLGTGGTPGGGDAGALPGGGGTAGPGTAPVCPPRASCVPSLSIALPPDQPLRASSASQSSAPAGSSPFTRPGPRLARAERRRTGDGPGPSAPRPSMSTADNGILRQRPHGACRPPVPGPSLRRKKSRVRKHPARHTPSAAGTVRFARSSGSPS